MKRILSVFLLIAMTVSTFAILPAQAAAPITSTEEDSIVPSPWDSIETEGGAFSSVPLPFLFATYLPAVGFTMRWCTSTKPV